MVRVTACCAGEAVLDRLKMSLKVRQSSIAITDLVTATKEWFKVKKGLSDQDTIVTQCTSGNEPEHAS